MSIISIEDGDMGDKEFDFLAEENDDIALVRDECLNPWVIGIIDDEPLVHEATRFALQEITIYGRQLTFYSAYSAREGFELIQSHPDMAVVLLDVVMEEEDSGLTLVGRIRNELDNKLIQIILRTGQPGYVPEEDLITRYEINSYKTKNELTRSKLFTTIAAALRSYQSLEAMERSRDGLRALIEASSGFLKERSVRGFAYEVQQQFGEVFKLSQGRVFCVSNLPTNGPISFKISEQTTAVVSATDCYSEYINQDIRSLTAPIFQLANRILESKSHQFEDGLGGLYLTTPSGWEAVMVAEQAESLKTADQEFLKIFCMNVAMGLENAEYFTQLNKAAFQDELTGLNNRVGFIEQASVRLNSRAEQHSLYLLDIDYFHQVTTSLGYEFGNLILKKMALTLRQLFGETTIISRLHSDVFAALVTGSAQSARDVAAKCSRPMIIEGQSIRMGLTVGMAQTDNGDEFLGDITKLITRAEVALHVAKENKRGSGEIFDAAYEKESYRSMMLLSDFREGLTRGELFLVLQPKVDINSQRVIGYEALVRWQHPIKGMVPPGAFIPSVEKSGIYYDLDLYVARALCELLNDNPSLTAPVSFNISANSLNHENFVAELKNVFVEQKIEFSRVEIEVTENALIHSEQSISRLTALYDAGFKIGLDDFGAGFSSLAYLLRLPLHTIKIDRSFVADIVDQPRSLILLEGILSIVTKLNKEIVVEGVETEQQRDLLVSLGVTVAQGFLFYKPLPIGEAIALLEHN